MLGVSWRVRGRGGFSTCNTTLHKPLEGDFLFAPLFGGLPALQGDAFFLCVILLGAKGSTATAASVNNVGCSFIQRVVNMAAALVLPRGREGVS
jgi:hypothetical protein